MRSATKNSKRPSRREAKKPPAGVNFAKVSNTVITTKNGAKLIIRPTLYTLLQAAKNDITVSAMHAIIDRFGVGMPPNNTLERWHRNVGYFMAAWNRQKGRCAISGLRLCGGPEFFGRGIGFNVVNSDYDNKLAYQIVAYPIAHTLLNWQNKQTVHHNFKVKVASFKGAGRDFPTLHWLVLRDLAKAIDKSRHLNNIPLHIQFIERRHAQDDSKFTLTVDAPGMFPAFGSHVSAYNPCKEIHKNAPFWWIYKGENVNVMTVHLEGGTLHYSRHELYKDVEIGDMRRGPYGFELDRYENKLRLTQRNNFTLELSNPDCTIQHINKTIIDMIASTYKNVQKFALQVTTSKELQPNGDNEYTKHDVWPPDAVSDQ